jgi:hypothetical protein
MITNCFDICAKRFEVWILIGGNADKTEFRKITVHSANSVDPLSEVLILLKC